MVGPVPVADEVRRHGDTTAVQPCAGVEHETLNIPVAIIEEEIDQLAQFSVASTVAPFISLANNSIDRLLFGPWLFYARGHEKH
jgi:hypothetical protein